MEMVFLIFAMRLSFRGSGDEVLHRAYPARESARGAVDDWNRGAAGVAEPGDEPGGIVSGPHRVHGHCAQLWQVGQPAVARVANDPAEVGGGERFVGT